MNIYIFHIISSICFVDFCFDLFMYFSYFHGKYQLSGNIKNSPQYLSICFLFLSSLYNAWDASVRVVFTWNLDKLDIPDLQNKFKNPFLQVYLRLKASRRTTFENC